jgi:hypothetical protein
MTRGGTGTRGWRVGIGGEDLCPSPATGGRRGRARGKGKLRLSAAGGRSYGGGAALEARRVRARRRRRPRATGGANGQPHFPADGTAAGLLNGRGFKLACCQGLVSATSRRTHAALLSVQRRKLGRFC